MGLRKRVQVMRILTATACFFALFTMGCGKAAAERFVEAERPSNQSLVKQPVKPATAEEIAAMAACLQDFSAQDDFGLRNDRWTLVVDRVTSRRCGCLSEAWLEADLQGRGWKIPGEVAKGFRCRNETRVSLEGAELGDHIIIDDFERLKSQVDPFPLEFGLDLVMQRVHPDTKAYVWLWRPGFSKDRSQCAIRLSWGWTPHGASALYLLANRNGKWSVLHRASRVGN
jgi:hypothetical protein